MKKVLAMLLIVCLLLPMAACGNKTQPAVQPGTSASEPVTPAEPAADPAAEPAEPEQETEKVWLPLVREGENNKLTIGIVTSANVTDYDDNAFTKWIEETTGIDLEFQQFSGTASDCVTQIALMIAAGQKLPDLLYYWSGFASATVNEYGEEGYFISLSDYMKDPEMNHFRDTALAEQFGEDADLTLKMMLSQTQNPRNGESYSYPCVQKAAQDAVIFPACINKVWLDKLGLDMPRTPDELYNVLVAFRDKDPNGNGKKDEIPMIGWCGHKWYDVAEYIINSYIYLCDLYHFNVRDGKVYVPYNTDLYREGLKFVRKLVDEGLLSPLSWSMGSRTELVALLNPVDGVATVGVSCGHPTLIWPSEEHTGLYDENFNLKWVSLPMLQDASGQGYGGYAPYQETEIRKYHYITADAENPELCYRLLDYLMSTEAMLRMRYGRPDIDWRYPIGEEAVGKNGKKILFINLNQESWTSPNNIHWHLMAGTCNSFDFFLGGSIAGGERRFTDYRGDFASELRDNYAAAGQPAEVCYTLSYTGEEADERADFTSDLTSYISKSRTAFCNGALDPNSDKDWNDYLDNLKQLRIDRWIEIAQTAYDRMNNG